MNKIRMLYISGSLGLGHITRDLAIARQLRKIIPEADIDWLAAHPATLAVQEAGEKLVPGAEEYADENAAAEKAASGAGLNLLKYLMKSRGEWRRNIAFFTRLIQSKEYDLVIGDETYEISLALREHPELKRFTFVMIFDFVGLDAMTRNPIERLGVYYWNRVWCHDYRVKRSPPYDLGLFIGMPDDVPDSPFGFGLPNRRTFANTMYTFTGYAFPFNPADYSDSKEMKKRLGYGEEPLVLVSLGGTAIGRELLERCGQAFPLIRERIPDVHFVFVTGPRLKADALQIPAGITVNEFIPNLYQHFAASDLSVVLGGATSTFELTALRRPFLYFPIEGHCEQANVSRILTKHGAGIPLQLSRTTPETLAASMTENIGREVNYPAIPVDGAEKAAMAIVETLKRSV